MNKILFKKLEKDSRIPEQAGGFFQLKIDKANPVKNQDGTIMLMLASTVSVTIPEGKLGILIPNPALSNSSLLSASPIYPIFSGKESGLGILFKTTNGNSEAAVPEIGETYALLTLVDQPKEYNFEIEEYVEPVETVEAQGEQAND